MNYVCLVKLFCNDGEIQIVVGSKINGTVSNLKEMTTLASTNCSLQSKVTELCGYINHDLVASEFTNSDKEFGKYESLNFVKENNAITLDVDESQTVDDMNDYNEEPTMHILSMTEVTHNDIINDTENDYNINTNEVNTDLLEKLVIDKYIDRKSTSQFSEVYNFLPKFYFHGVQSQMLKDMEDEEPFKCNLCGEYFKTLMDMRNHLKATHRHNSKKIVFGCRYCEKVFAEACIVKHFYSHKKPFKCTHCDKTFSDQGNLKRHLMYEKGIYKHICNVCGFRCVSEHELNSHMVKHNTTLTHMCPHCGKTFARTSQLNRHVGTHNQSRDYQCIVCAKFFKTLSDCRIHQRIHNINRTRTYQCSMCDKGYFKKVNLMKHKETYH